MPPSTVRVVPVTYDAAGEARKPTQAATSAGVPAAALGSRRRARRSSSAVISVSISPGATALTVTPRRATSTRHGPGERDQPRLGRGVVRLAGVRPHAHNRGDVDDAPEAGADHRAERAPGEAKGGAEVGLDNPIPVSVAESQGEPIGGDPGVVDKDARPGQARPRQPQQSLGGTGLADVGRRSRSPRPRRSRAAAATASPASRVRSGS